MREITTINDINKECCEKRQYTRLSPPGEARPICECAFCAASVRIDPKHLGTSGQRCDDCGALFFKAFCYRLTRGNSQQSVEKIQWPQVIHALLVIHENPNRLAVHLSNTYHVLIDPAQIRYMLSPFWKDATSMPRWDVGTAILREYTAQKARIEKVSAISNTFKAR